MNNLSPALPAELRSKVSVTPDQRLCAEAMAFGLKDLSILDRAELADPAIDRTDIGRRCQGSGIWTQGTGKEVVETGIACRIGHLRFSQIDAETPYERPDHQGRDFAQARTGDAPDQFGQGPFGEQVLDESAQSIDHAGA